MLPTLPADLDSVTPDTLGQFADAVKESFEIARKQQEATNAFVETFKKLREEGDDVVICAQGYEVIQKYYDTSGEKDEELSKYVKQLQKIVSKKKHEIENRERFDFEWVVIKLLPGWLLLKFLTWLFS